MQEEFVTIQKYDKGGLNPRHTEQHREKKQPRNQGIGKTACENGIYGVLHEAEGNGIDRHCKGEKDSLQLFTQLSMLSKISSPNRCWSIH